MTDYIARVPALSRRMALKAVAAMAAASTASYSAASADLTLARPGAAPAGTPTDPDLRNPGAFWPSTLSEAQLDTLAAVVDVMLPADERSPAASALGCHEFIDEWVSAPYPRQREDREELLGWLTWLGAACQQRHGEARFEALDAAAQIALIEDLCQPTADAEAQTRFRKIRQLAAGAYWTTLEGMADLGYMGNRPLPKWELPPNEVLEHLGLAPSDIP